MQELETEDLAVTIKVLKVNSKKMTQSVFRQLPEKVLLDEKLDFAGKPWGTVNHFWGKQNTYGLHVVWEMDGKLYRSIINSLQYTARKAKQLNDHEEINIARELPHMALYSAINKRHDYDEGSAEVLFQKYRDQFSSLKEIDQLYIST